MIKSGLIVKNRFLSGGAYPSDYNAQGRTGSYSVTRPGNVDNFDTGFETASNVSPYQERVEEYSSVTPRSVYKPKKIRAKNLAKFGPTAYNSMFGKKADELSDYVAQRFIGLVDADSRYALEGNIAPPPTSKSSSNDFAMPQQPTYAFALDLPDKQLEVNAVVESNPSDVLNVIGDTVEQETEVGSATVKIPSRSFSFAEDEFDPSLLMTDTYHNLQRQAKAMGYVPDRPTKPEFLKSKRL